MEQNKFIDQIALECLRKDFSILLRGTEGKKLEDIDLDQIIGLLDMLKNEVNDVKNGVRARDRFICHSFDVEESRSLFKKVTVEPERTGITL